MVIAAFIAALVVPSAFGLGLMPVNLLPPSISGSAQQGQMLTCSPGKWLNSPTSYTYTWQRTGSNIGGATSQTYTLTGSDVGQAITCTVVAKNASGSSLPAISLPVIPVGLPIGLIPIATGFPVISGTAAAGQTLTCSNGSWTNSPTSYSYSWQRNVSNIPGAGGPTYTLTSADVNQLITCTVVASNTVGSSVPAVSLPVIPISLFVPVNTALPQISGTPQVGRTLTCSPGSWTNSPTSYTYGWQRDLVNMTSATGPSYTVTAADVGHSLTCEVYASNTFGQSLPAISQPVSPSGGPGGTQGTGAPVIGSFSLKPRRIVERVKHHHLRTKGARFSYRVNESATVLITIQKRLKSGRYVKVGQLTVRNASAGSHSLKWAARLHRRLVGSGRYRATIVAQNANGRSHSRALTFRVSRRRA